MFELADRLVGIYKTHDATKSVTINPRLFSEAVAGQSKGGAGVGGDGQERAARGVLGDATNIYA